MSCAGLLGWTIEGLVVGITVGFCLCVAGVSQSLKTKVHNGLEDIPPK